MLGWWWRYRHRARRMLLAMPLPATCSGTAGDLCTPRTGIDVAQNAADGRAQILGVARRQRLLQLRLTPLAGRCTRRGVGRGGVHE